METVTLTISGMSCGHCVTAVDTALRGLAGVDVQEVRVGEVTLAYDPAAVSPDAIADAVADEGYAVESTKPA